MDDVQVRPARADECECVVALWTACGLVIPANDPRADFRLAQDGCSSDVLVGTVDGVIVASVMVGSDGHRGWLYYVATRPQHRGRGLGRAMVAAAEDWLAARGIAKVQLLVRETNAAVTAFYERLGYATAPRIVMGKRIG